MDSNVSRRPIPGGFAFFGRDGSAFAEYVNGQWSLLPHATEAALLAPEGPVQGGSAFAAVLFRLGSTDPVAALARLFARIAALEGALTWIPVGQRLPETLAPVLARFQRGTLPDGAPVWCYEVCVYSRVLGWCATAGNVADVSDWREIEVNP